MNNYQGYPQGLADPSIYHNLTVNHQVDNSIAYQIPGYRYGIYGDWNGYPYPVHGQVTNGYPYPVHGQVTNGYPYPVHVHQPTPVVEKPPQGRYIFPLQSSEGYPPAPYQPPVPNYASSDGAANPAGIAAVHPQNVVVYPDSLRAVKVPDPWKYFYLINENTGLALGASGGAIYEKIHAGLEVVVSSITDPNVQRWCAHDENEKEELQKSGILHNASNNGLVLDGRTGFFVSNRVRVEQYIKNKAEQQWILDTDGRIRNKMRRDECLDVEDGGEGRFVIASKVKNKPSQMWRMKIVADNDSQ